MPGLRIIQNLVPRTTELSLSRVLPQPGVHLRNSLSSSLTRAVSWLEIDLLLVPACPSEGTAPLQRLEQDLGSDGERGFHMDAWNCCFGEKQEYSSHQCSLSSGTPQAPPTAS